MVYDSECSKSVTLNINGKLRTLMLRKFTCTTRIFCTFFFVVVILFFFPMIYFILRVLWHSVVIKRIWFRVFILVFSFLCHWRIQILQIEYILISIFSVSSHNHDLYNLYFDHLMQGWTFFRNYSFYSSFVSVYSSTVFYFLFLFLTMKDLQELESY